jgi:hypothetical protein
MHALYGLQKLGLKFELKGGTSLSKGHQIINRFSEDIDIRIEPPPELHVKTGRNHTKLRHVESRRNFYDWLAKTIRVDGITEVKRDTAFDNKVLTSGGIRLSYDGLHPLPTDLKEGVLLEAGFDVVTPNEAKDISSWAYDYAAGKVDVIDNRAKGVACYDPRYTFVEKLQTIRRSSGVSRRRRGLRSTSCGTTTTPTAYCSGQRFRPLSGRMPTRPTRRSDFAAETTPTFPRTKPSC